MKKPKRKKIRKLQFVCEMGCNSYLNILKSLQFSSVILVSLMYLNPKFYYSNCKEKSSAEIHFFFTNPQMSPQ